MSSTLLLLLRFVALLNVVARYVELIYFRLLHDLHHVPYLLFIGLFDFRHNFALVILKLFQVLLLKDVFLLINDLVFRCVRIVFTLLFIEIRLVITVRVATLLLLVG